MELVSHVMPMRNRQSEVLLMPVGDIQWYGDGAAVALGMLQRHIDWGVKQGAYFLGMGDYIDAFSPSNRERFKSAHLYDTAMRAVDDKAEDLVNDLFNKALKPSKGRWLGLLEGHHFHEFRNGTTTDQLLADKLDAKFLGTSAYVRLQFQRMTSKGNVVIWCHHGRGGGRRLSGPLNQLDVLPAHWHGDIFLVGHHHKKVVGPVDYQIPLWHSKGARLVHRTKILACTGGFLKGYVPGSRQGLVPRGGYVEQAMLPPVALGGVLVRIRPRWCRENGQDVWLPDLSVEA